MKHCGNLPGVGRVCAAGVGTTATAVTVWYNVVFRVVVEVLVDVESGLAGGASGVGCPIFVVLVRRLCFVRLVT